MALIRYTNHMDNIMDIQVRIADLCGFVPVNTPGHHQTLQRRRTE